MTVQETADDNRALRYVALGDSYTIGTSVSPAERWPDLLVEALGSRPPTLRLVANLGVNGYTTRDLIRDELPALRTLEPGFASLLIGVNDVVQGVSPATYETNVATILDALLVHVPADRIFSMAIPDYTVTPAGGCRLRRSAPATRGDCRLQRRDGSAGGRSGPRLCRHVRHFTARGGRPVARRGRRTPSERTPVRGLGRPDPADR